MPDNENPAKLLLRAVDIGEHLIKIADTLGEDIAANLIAAGLEILRTRAETALALGERSLDKPQTLN